MLCAGYSSGTGQIDTAFLKNPGSFGPILVRSGRFGPISGVSHLSPLGAGHLGPISQVGCFGLIFGVSRFSLIYFYWESR